jgi:cytoskeleton protein RodZ
MGSFGENLRREREMRGISLDEIAASTKINLRFLHAIENDDLRNLPGGIFRRSFIRAYARYLGLDEDQIIAEYQTAARPDELGPPMFVPSSSSPGQERRPLFLPFIVAVVMLAGGYWIFRYAHRTDDLPAANPAATPVQTAPSHGDSAPLATGSHENAGASAPQNSATAPANATDADTPRPENGTPNVGPTAEDHAAEGSLMPPNVRPGATTASADMILKVAARERVWVSVDADGKTALQRTLNPQDSQTVKAKDHFDVTTGNAQGLMLTLNGEQLKPLGRQGEVKRVRLRRSGVMPSR